MHNNIAFSFLVHGQQKNELAPSGSLPASMAFKQAHIVNIPENGIRKKIGKKV